MEYYPKLHRWLEILPQQLESALDISQNSNISIWKNAIAELPEICPTFIDIQNSVTLKHPQPSIDKTKLKKTLQKFHPWRKGPFHFFDIHIDTEWRSDWKWDRVKNAICLQKKTVLDVGCGNGYHCWRMAGTGAELVVGVDPLPLYTMQYQIFAKYISASVYVVPLKLEDVPKNLEAFDCVFSMGVLYHRRSPIDHIYHLKSCLQPRGQLILETLVIDGINGMVLVPEERYAKMRNVWFIPSVLTLEAWLKRCGFVNIELIDVTVTSTKEQRSTPWMQFESLENFLSPSDPSQTIEGLPSPKRAIFSARKR